jgi:cyclopropane fatty-acyl-phospholipid synthase-like methyltransferase
MNGNGLIWTGKDGYTSRQEFEDRTRRAMGGDDAFWKYDGKVPKANDRQVEAIKALLAMREPGDVLDVGCGYGRYAVELAGLYRTYTGIDVVESRIHYAAATYANPQASFQWINPADWQLGRQFDAIFAVTVVDHLTVPDAATLLSQAAKHLKPDGELLLYEGCLGYWTEEQAEQMYASGRQPEHMIPKPISLLEQLVPDLSWQVLGGLRYRLRLRRSPQS